MSVQAIDHLSSILPSAASTPAAAPEATSSSAGNQFSEMLANTLQDTNSAIHQADASAQEMVNTQGTRLHETMISLARAEISLRFTTKMGQKLIRAYEEISRMQI